MEFYFSGTIERIIFENPSSFFRILLLDIDDTDADFDDFEIIVTGTMADIMEGEDYTFWGNLVQHPKYGEQLKITRYERAKPTSKGLVKYFSSDHFKGIGVKTAQKIVDLYGDNTIDKVLAEPEKLKDIAGLSAKNCEAFLTKLRQNYGTERILAKLSEYSIPNKLAFQVQDFYKEETLEIVEHYPYQLVEDIQGIGFKIADQLAQSLGIESTAPERFRAGLLHTLLTQSMEKGDTYLEAKELLEHTIELLESSRQIELDPSSIADELAHLIEEDKVQNIDTKIFENSLFFAEEGIRSNLLRILEKGKQNKFEPKKIEAAIAQIENEFAISYDVTQKQAICDAINHKIFILTGGPGTGKTTVINGIIAVYALLHGLDLRKSQDLPILLAAPTGRATRRMNELTGLPSATIHRHLGMTGDDDTSHLDDYLDADFIIVDEFSMVDTWLANQLLSNISSNTKLLIVGDADQLPSVSPGQVLADLLKIPLLPQTKLEKIYRQSKDSTIVNLASQIQKGILPPDFIEKKADRSYFEAHSEHIPKMIERIVEAALRSGIPAQDVQVLAPMYRGQAGIDHINQLMQNLINPAETEQIIFEATDCQYRQGDKVIHLVNDAESNVFNGDLGYITDLLPAKYTDSKQDELTINFDGNEVIYPRSEWYKIRLAYAMSIHKSQGSEFPVVILPITSSSHRMLQRNLIYTAITRAKSKLILLGEKSAFDFAVKNTGTARNTYLIQRFSDLLTDEKVIHTSVDNLETTVGNYVLTEENFLKINPMIGITDEDIQNVFGE
ncbi:ATP-dependent RecD-like DNA helicase [Streptococcus anginosus]|uniref:ATP-dependent RecD2 DNA helicase n=1 Tax=Streptococcus anginosus SK1138 TaxID=1161422 RepID=A0AAD2T9Y8_STRAP|nr:ATP-dependent RecD-like DNA helicase [Streptococcus anginosus]EJP27316.1 helicase, RecD/TraA family [Streptococcus anginosus SK1138]MCY7223890.1 ATP-dependent RecD-like DNA helicase [Streptococcus anginosus]RIB36216.1 ATP-dependent RecD-like DNA helicase [Streptococcus anginosus]